MTYNLAVIGVYFGLATLFFICQVVSFASWFKDDDNEPRKNLASTYFCTLIATAVWGLVPIFMMWLMSALVIQNAAGTKE